MHKRNDGSARKNNTGTPGYPRLDAKQEQQLVHQACQDVAAFHALYDRYFPRVYSYVHYRVGQVQDAEDLVSQTFLKALEGMHRFEYREGQSFASWLFRIAHNLVNDLYSRPQHEGTTVPIDAVLDLPDPHLLPDDVAVQQEQFNYLRQLIRTLSPRRQEVIILKFYGGLRNREIAGALGLDERSVASHLCRGLEDLQQRYSETMQANKKEKS